MHTAPLLLLFDEVMPLPGTLLGRFSEAYGVQLTLLPTEITAALALLRRTAPPIVLLPLGPDPGARLRAVAALHQAAPAAALLLTGLPTAGIDITAFVRAGIVGFLMAEATVEEAVGTVRTVGAGGRVLPRELTRALFLQLTAH